ncbi:MAG: hypothetical protein E7C49_15130 [Clostridium sp.]|nr:hypothetical protein [Clostridium sp.]
MALYIVTSLFSLVMEEPKLSSKPLGILIKNDIIEVLKFYNNWAYFKYEDQDAYTHSYNLAELTKEKDKESYKNNKDDELSDLIPSMIFKDVYNKATK